MIYLGLFFAGMLLCNALPHLISGVEGRRFFTPWSRPRWTGRSSPIENALWGSANLLLGVFLIDRLFPKNVPHGLTVLAAGFVLMAIVSAIVFGRRQAS